MPTWSNVVFEIVKLVLQFGGAIYIARRTVEWALKRYKREKHWERRLQAYADLLAALGTMNQILNEWENDEMEQAASKPEVDEENRKRYNAARQKLEEAVGVAELLLSPEIAEMLSSLNVDLRNARFKAQSWVECIGAEWAVLDKLRKALLANGRVDLKIA